MPSATTPDLDPDDLAAFVAIRPRLFGIAYRILGTASDAEDIVQDTWLSWQRADRTKVREPAAFLATTAARNSLNLAQSARVRREVYPGPWLPEPVATDDDPTLGAERGEALELAVLMLLERLSALERAAYVLREAFAYTFVEIAEILSISEASARKHVTRSRKHLAEERRRPVDELDRRRLLDAFLVAARGGDLRRLEGLLTADAVSFSDGGGVVHAAQKPIVGRESIVRFMDKVGDRLWRDVEPLRLQVNGAPGAALMRDGAVVGFISIAASGDGIARIMTVLNPGKLARLQLDVDRLRPVSTSDVPKLDAVLS